MKDNKFISGIKHFLFMVFGRLLPDALWADKLYLKIFYKHKQGETLSFCNPVTFNAKTQWLKLYDRKDLYTAMVDKYEVKKIVAQCIGEEHIIPTIGCWERFEDIDFEKLPEKFVLKTNHDSGGVLICTDKSKIDYEKAKKCFNKKLKTNYYYNGREWPYKNVRLKILAEEYMEDVKDEDLKDYKVYVFNGKVKCIHVDYDRFTNHRRNFYDCDWNYLPFTTLYPTDPKHIIEKPAKLDEMIEFAEAITKRIDTPAFLRVDFYIIKGKIYFGETTFYHGSGLERFYPVEWGKTLGDWISLD